MTAWLSLLPALLIGSVCLHAWRHGVDLYEAMTAGAAKGLRLTTELLPTLVVMFSALYLLRASGLPELMGRFLGPLLHRIGIPEETAILMILRPFSGSGALAAASELIALHGADTLIGRTAAVMIGASETTFYVTALYSSASGVRGGRWVIPAALCADLACFLASAWICRLLY